MTDSGAIETKALLDSMRSGDVSLLSENLKGAAAKILTRMEIGQIEVQALEYQIDAACFADMSDYAQKSGEDVAVTFVKTQADLINLVMLLRVKKSKAGEATLKSALLPGGTVNPDKFILALEVADEQLISHLGLTRYKNIVSTGIDQVQKGGTFGLLERQCDDALLKLLRDKRYAREGVAPLMGYLLAKEREAQAVRLVVMSRRNDVPLAMTQERLRELYA